MKMDEIKRLYVGTISTEETNVLDLTNGAVLKTILICNNSETEQTIEINVDSSVFLFTIEAKKTLIIDNAIVCNILKLKASAELDVHISGIQLGGA